MSRIVCDVPIRIRVTGRLGEAELKLLEDAVRKGVVAQLAAASAAVAAGPAGPAGPGASLAGRHSARSATAGDPGALVTLVPSYQDRGAPVPVPVRRTAADRGADPAPGRRALARIGELLRTGLTDWFVTDAEARQVLAILRALSPVDLLDTVQVMRLSDQWRAFRRELPESDRGALSALELAIDPNSGYLSPGDRIRLEVRTRGGVESEVSAEYEVRGAGVALPYLDRPVPVEGLLPEQAATIIATAWNRALIYVDPLVRLVAVFRGHHYAPRHGPTAGSLWVESRPLPASPAERTRRDRRAGFLSYVRAVTVTDPLVTDALMAYLNWVERHADLPDFHTRTPASVWEESLAAAGRGRPAEPAGRTAPYLALAQSIRRLADTAAPDERARLIEALGRFLAWLDIHRADPTLATTDPLAVWTATYRPVFRAELAARLRAAERAAADLDAEARWESALRMYDAATRFVISKVLRMPGVRRLEDREHGIGYLVSGSETEREVRERVATDYMADLRRRMAEPGFIPTDAGGDFTAWLRAHPAHRQALLLAQAYPEAEPYDAPIDIPAWQTAVEVGIGFIPIVGSVVAGYEVVSGRDLFGHELSTVERGILAAAVLLPAAARLGRLGRAALTTARIARDYRLTQNEARALLRATARVRPGSVGAHLLGETADDVRAGRPVRDPRRLRELEDLLRDMGMTDPATAQDLRAPRGAVPGIEGARAEGEAAGTVSREPGAAGREPGAAGHEPPPPPEPPGGAGGPGGGGGPGVPTLRQRQRGAALRTEAARAEARADQLAAESARQEGEAEIAAASGRPERATRLRLAARARRNAEDLVRRDAARLRAEAAEYESGARSATAGLPGAEDISGDIDDFIARAESGPFIHVPLDAVERHPEQLERLMRGIMTGRSGTRVVYHASAAAGRIPITVAANGDVAFARDRAIYLNFGSPERALEYGRQKALEFARQNRGTGMRILRFEIDEEWVRSLRSAASPQFKTRTVPGVPRLVDIRFADDQMGISSPDLIDELERFVVPGSGRVIFLEP